MESPMATKQNIYTYYKSRFNQDRRGNPLNCRYCDTQIQIGGAISFKPNASGWKYVHICTKTSCIAECISEYKCEKSLKEFVSREFNPDAPNPRQCDAQGFCTYPFDRDVNTIMRGLGGRFNGNHPSGNKGWQMPLEIGLRANIVSVLTSANFEIDATFGNLDNAVMGDIEKNRTEHLEWAKSKGLYEFQIGGVEWLLRNKRCLLGDDMGLGKTVQSLCAIERDGKGRVIIIVPSSLKLNWLKECKVWRSDYSVKVVMGSACRKRNPDHIKSFRLPEQGEIIICNFEQVPKTFDKAPTGELLAGLKECSVIVDECHALKNSKATRTKRVRNITWYSKTSWGLSGTPLLNRPMDLWGVLASFGLAKRVFGNFDTFVEKMGGDRGGYGGRIQWHFGTVAEDVPTLIQRAMLRRTKKMALPGLPSKLRNTVWIEMDKDIVKTADKLWKQYSKGLTEDKSAHERREEIVAISKQIREDIAEAQFEYEAEMSEYLREYGEDFAYGGGVRKAKPEKPVIATIVGLRKELATRKVEVALPIIEEFEDDNRPLVVFSAHVEPCKIIGAREGWGCITGATPTEERQRLVDAFQKGELKGLVGTIKAMGVGLTLLTDVGVADCDSMLFIDLEWNPSLNAQAEDRICRIHKGGKVRERCTYITLAYEHDIDRKVVELVENKQLTIDQSIELASDCILPQSNDMELSRLQELARSTVPVVVDVDLDDVLSEVAKARTKREREQAKAKAKGRYEGYRSKWVAKPEVKAVIEEYPEIPANVKFQIKGAISYLRAVCDGAKSKDNAGFNKPDASTMHLMDLAEVWEGDDRAYHIAWGRLWKYRGQIEHMFPLLHDKKIAKLLNKDCKR